MFVYACTLFSTIQVESFEARVGRRGHIRVKGGLPISTDPKPSPTSTPMSEGMEAPMPREAPGTAIGVELQGLELRVRNVYTGKPRPIIFFPVSL
jgi:hypothetical protein